jgi:hypothetical protein
MQFVSFSVIILDAFQSIAAICNRLSGRFETSLLGQIGFYATALQDRSERLGKWLARPSAC